MKKRNFVKRLCCLMLAVILTMLTGVESAQATTMSTVDITAFKPMADLMRFESYTEMPGGTLPFDGKYNYKEKIPKGELVYIKMLYVTCDNYRYYVVNYKGKGYYVNESAIKKDQLKKINAPKRKTKDDVVKTKGAIGDVLKGDDYRYIYSSPDDSNPANCYACAPAGSIVQIVDKNYNSDWMKQLQGYTRHWCRALRRNIW